jgi:vancomycin resistance protein VanJ
MTAPAQAASPGRPRRAARIVTWLCTLYTFSIALVWLLVWAAGDRWWPATIVMFIPWYAWALPLVALAPAALLVRRRLLWVLAFGLGLLLGPVMGLCLPWRLLLAGDRSGPQVRVMTCNVHYNQLDTPALAAVLRETNPDIVALQYWSSRDEKVLFDPAVWHIRNEHEFGLATRYKIHAIEPLGHPPCAVRYDLEAPIGPLHFFNLHLNTPRDGLLAVQKKGWAGVPELEANIARRREESREITGWLAPQTGPVLIAGDFNTPTGSAIYREHWSSHTNAFSVAGFGWGLTQFTTHRTAVRIDHILAGPGWRVRRCWVGPFVGSEHRPVIADLEWVGAEE